VNSKSEFSYFPQAIKTFIVNSIYSKVHRPNPDKYKFSRDFRLPMHIYSTTTWYVVHAKNYRL